MISGVPLSLAGTDGGIALQKLTSHGSTCHMYPSTAIVRRLLLLESFELTWGASQVSCECICIMNLQLAILRLS